MVKTKIICRLGPASSSETVLRKMMRAGMDVARLNFSHGKPQELLHKIGLIRLLNAKYDDGNISLEVIGRAKDRIKAKVIIGGLLKEHKGVNIPEARLEFSGINRKDVEDIFFCEKHGVEYIAQSFVRTKNDILDVRKLFKTGSRCQIVAKIENIEGIKNIDEIIKVSDGIMIARGGMGGVVAYL